MKAPTKRLVTATALMAVALSCIGCGTSATNAGIAAAPTPSATAAPTASPTPAPTPSPTAAPSSSAHALPTSGEPVALAPGRYTFAKSGSNPAISVTVPSGWLGSSLFVGGNDSGVPGTDGPVLFAWPLDHGFKDPCTDHTPVVPAAGSGAAGLLDVIAGQPGLDAGPRVGDSIKGITDVTVGGHDGKYVEYTVTADPAACGTRGGFWIWGSCPAPVTIGCEDGVNGDARWGVSKGDRERLYAIDVDGKTYTFFTNQPADLSAADRAELQQVLDTLVFEPAG